MSDNPYRDLERGPQHGTGPRDTGQRTLNPAVGGVNNGQDTQTEETEIEIQDLSDVERTRRSSHVILDALMGLDPANPDSEQTVNALQGAVQQLLEVGAVELNFDEGSEELELDLSPLITGVVNLVNGLVEELAVRGETTRDEVVRWARSGLDA